MKGKSRSLNSVHAFCIIFFKMKFWLGGCLSFVCFGFLIFFFKTLPPPFCFRAPLSVNLKARNLAKEIHKHLQGTTLPVTNKGCC